MLASASVVAGVVPVMRRTKTCGFIPASFSGQAATALPLESTATRAPVSRPVPPASSACTSSSTGAIAVQVEPESRAACTSPPMFAAVKTV